ncbi:uncharacterized protein [Fopius arisanus]|uniref:GlgC_1 protein n=2 Tax=Fopius arisanus TaxID=64838 RepID=A0A0C9QX99_9HYME|nr:PREDICTED: uncharacterized protein LOC105266412 [Fopius arisanus]XP_011302855.1 PREDICTED: uncharacterized protein LOC105266412 [Fopius arisanus]XP_011302856.1 PREDICTED: uncharacterized protein LOC105266412 [Fopius arisanus]
MGMSEINTWVLIRRYDKLESEHTNLQTTLQLFTLTPNMVSEELKSSIFRWIGVEDDGSKFLKIRRHDNNLIPFSTLLSGATRDKPFIIDVVAIHQFCPVEQRTILPDYIDALRSSFYNLDNRVKLVEQAMPNLTTCQMQAFEETVSHISNCVSFLDRRLDELAPPIWRNQAKSAI